MNRGTFGGGTLAWDTPVVAAVDTSGGDFLDIQAAVDIVPKTLRCNVTIKIAAGIYREEVTIANIQPNEAELLILLGDESTVPLVSPAGNS